MKTILEMARAAGCHDNGEEFRFVELRYLERFAEMVRADEREKYKWGVHSCGPTCKRYACVAMREAVEAENEACAKVADENAAYWAGYKIAAAIRARRNT